MTTTVWEGRTASEWQTALRLPAVHLYDVVGSTNDEARRLAEAGCPSLTLVISDQQTRGRGRAGRSWLSAPGSSLLCSIVFRVQASEASVPGTAPVRLGHAVARAIADVAHAEARVKWPNDVVIAGHGKVAGVLCEAVMRGGDAFVIAGIGVNVNAPGGDFASLNEIGSRNVRRGDLLERIVSEVELFADHLTAPLSHAELAMMADRDVLLNHEIVDDDGRNGIARGLAPDGSLLVETSAGLTSVHNATIRLAGTREYPGASV